ncbi:MAG TPA: L-aspartate oxidase [Deltaproteobacteria bacterium]|nr:L-aspartate oxidase [Deltaproteobacteria bacterium]HCP44853.1 L-aspartate oxidase [Deltaproteobacteria bacterium]
MSRDPRKYSCDFLVVGGGLAGLSFALDVAEHGSVILLVKDEPDRSNTAWAQGGIAAVWDEEDSIDQHVEDTLQAGVLLADDATVRGILEEGPGAVRQLIDWGVQFTRARDLNGDSSDVGSSPSAVAPDEAYDLTREGGHSARRVLHAGDLTGREIQRAMLAAVQAHPRIQLLSHHVAIDLITERKMARHRVKRRLGLMGPEVERRYGPGGPEGWMPGQPDRCRGVYALDSRTGAVEVFQAGVTLLATGGAGKVYRYTSNPDLATGDGMAMAYRAGAILANMEFVQFHPTCLYHPQAKTFLLSEAIRGEGGVLRLPDGRDFMQGVHPLASLAPRDIVAREIDAQIKRHGLECVLLDVTHLDAGFLRNRFPGIDERLRQLGMDMTQEPIPVVPAAHYFCGGVVVDSAGRTLLRGLLAAGEVSCTGLHGANRLASNSLLEAVVYGRRAAQTALEERDGVRADDLHQIPPWDSGKARDPDELVVIAHTWDEIRRLMWNYVGIVRTDRRLLRALARIGLIKEEIQTYYWNFTVTRDLVELRNIVTVAELVIRSALGRRESRGLHYNLSCPDRDDTNWRRKTLLRREW